MIATRRKTARRGRLIEPAYLIFVRSLGCIVCRDKGNLQETRTEAAHCGDRGLGQKCSDRETIPLCAWHHRIGPESQHVLGKGFWTHHGLEKDKLFAQLQAVFNISGGAE